jgi:hypothetical protein
MSGTTPGSSVVSVKSGSSDNLWEIDSGGQGQVDVVAMPNVTIEGAAGTVAVVTSNRLWVSDAGGAAGGTAVSVNADGNVWEVNSSRAGTVRLVSINDTPVDAVSAGVHGFGGVYVAQGLPNPLGGAWHVQPGVGSVWSVNQAAASDPWNVTWAEEGPVKINNHATQTVSLSKLNHQWGVNGVGASSFSNSYVCSSFLYFTFQGQITVPDGTPTDIRFGVQFKANDNTWVWYRPNWWGDVRWSDTAVVQSRGGVLSFSLDGMCVANKIRGFCTSFGHSIGNSFVTEDVEFQFKA